MNEYSFKYFDRFDYSWEHSRSDSRPYGAYIPPPDPHEDARLACQSGELSSVKSFFQHSSAVNINAVIDEATGYTPLLWCCRHRQTDQLSVAECLIDLGANVNFESKNKTTALLLACEFGSHDVVRKLLERGAVKTAKNTDKDGVLQCSARGGDLQTIQQFYTNEPAAPLLLLAARHNKNLETVNFLLNQPHVDFNAVNDQNVNCSCLAAEFGTPEILSAIIHKAQNHLVQTKNGQSILHFACRNRTHPEVVALLLTEFNITMGAADKEGVTPLMLAAEFSSLEAVTLLIQKQVCDVNQKDKQHQQTAMMKATYNTNKGVQGRIMARLIEAGADIKPHDDQRLSAFGHACMHGSMDAVNFCLHHGCDINAREGRDYSAPLLIAMQHNASSHVMRALLAAKPNLDQKCSLPIKEKSFSCLHCAAALCKDDNVKVFKTLLESIPDLEQKINVKDNGLTPLDLAVEAGNLEVAMAMVKEKGAFGTPTPEWVPWMYKIIRAGQADLLVALANAKFPINFRGDDQVTTPDLALKLEQWDIVAVYVHVRAIQVSPQDVPKWFVKAASKGHNRLVHLLLDSFGANIEAKWNGQTALEAAVANQHWETVTYLGSKHARCSYRAPPTWYHGMAKTGTDFHFAFYFEEDAERLNVTDKYGKTPLHYAVENKHWSQVHDIGRRCWSRFKPNESLWVPELAPQMLCLAVGDNAEQVPDVTDMLDVRSINPNGCDKDGLSALVLNLAKPAPPAEDIAKAKAGFDGTGDFSYDIDPDKMLQLLLQYGADVDDIEDYQIVRKNSKKVIAEARKRPFRLCFAAFTNNCSLLRRELERGLNPNVRAIPFVKEISRGLFSKGPLQHPVVFVGVPLLCASVCQSLHAVRLLLLHGKANVDAKIEAMSNETTLSLAVQNKSVGVVMLLLLFGANPSLVNFADKDSYDLYDAMTLKDVLTLQSNVLPCSTEGTWKNSANCVDCGSAFSSLTKRRHHCRHCGNSVCTSCKINAPTNLCKTCQEVVSLKVCHDGLVANAEAGLAKGEHIAVIDFLSSALKEDDSDTRLWGLKIRAYLLAKKITQATATAEALQKRWPASPHVPAAHGEIALHRNDLPEARKQLNQALMLDETDQFLQQLKKQVETKEEAERRQKEAARAREEQARKSQQEREDEAKQHTFVAKMREKVRNLKSALKYSVHINKNQSSFLVQLVEDLAGKLAKLDSLRRKQNGHEAALSARELALLSNAFCRVQGVEMFISRMDRKAWLGQLMASGTESVSARSLCELLLLSQQEFRQCWSEFKSTDANSSTDDDDNGENTAPKLLEKLLEAQSQDHKEAVALLTTVRDKGSMTANATGLPAGLHPSITSLTDEQRDILSFSFAVRCVQEHVEGCQPDDEEVEDSRIVHMLAQDGQQAEPSEAPLGKETMLFPPAPPCPPTTFAIDPEEIALEMKGRPLRPVVLGAGTFGVVHRGTWRGMPVAVKELTHNVTEAECKIIRQETSLLGVLCHPHIVTTYGVFTPQEENDDDDPPVTIVMELVPKSFAVLLFDLEQKLQFKDQVRMGMEICSALVFLHNLPRPVTHRDLKPENVLLTSDLHVRVVDFGLATMRRAQSTRATGRAKGTPAYMAPELQTHGGDHRVDCFSLGVLLWALFTRTSPFADVLSSLQLAAQIQQGKRPDVSSLPSWIAEMVQGLWHQDPEERWSCARALDVLISQK
eukprot:m.163809 g.163809  ORF g.163809 m.163809 type:complete len:1694 (-) comp24922_c0_seq1:253-5334(-)